MAAARSGLPAIDRHLSSRHTLNDVQVGRVADDYVHDNPWRSVGVAAGFGFIVGLLIGRR
jgi:ElaB/YqjD/DUF883 family membrane-anchored ribosome-binding protein